ncbi:MAG: hypothetical protein K2Q18_18510, partial [Bdellovibrionales bacterium]|nr:hypothetical protein [Bdellovibrionales bacterium]
FLLQVQDFVFKTKSSVVQYNQRGFLLFRLPIDVKLEEKRIHPRVYIDPVEKRYISAKFANKDKSVLDVNCPVYNISESGICIIISKETLSSIKLNSEIELEGLSFFESLGNEMKAVVRNARVHIKKELGSDEFYALGLEFKKINAEV